jgi:uncharacterized protein (DUF433 family)
MSDGALRTDKHGDIRIGKSRVLLDTILERYKAGTPVEEIIHAYETLNPANVYEAIAYYLRYKEEVEAYLQRREAEAKILWKKIEAEQPSNVALKKRIKERWAK